MAPVKAAQMLQRPVTGYIRIFISVLAGFAAPRKGPIGILVAVLVLLPSSKLLAERPVIALPEWLDLGVDMFTRVQSDRSHTGSGPTSFYGLHRTRLSLAARLPLDVRFFVEGQDSRAHALSGNPREGDHFDLQQAYFEIELAQGWSLRFGRQEFAFGDERLIGSDSDWCHLGLSYDGARLSYENPRFRLDGFASFPVAHQPGAWNRPQDDLGLHGLYSTWKLPRGGGELDGYVILKHRQRSAQGPEAAGNGKRYTLGFRHAASLPGGFETSIEVAGQTGRWSGDRVLAWAGHFEVGRRLWESTASPRLSIEYNYATGDATPDDGKQEQFDDLFPAAYDQYGLPDPFAWSNLHSVGASVGWAPGESLELTAGGRWLRPAVAGRLGTSPADRGGQVAFMGSYRVSERWSLYLGYSHLFVDSVAESHLPSCTPFVGIRYRL